MKRIFFFLICCMFLFTVSCCYAQTGNSGIFISGDWTYKENGKGITLTDYRGNEENLSIPSELDGQAVTQLGNDLFYGNLQLRSVYIPGTVTDIGTNAFFGCTALENVQLSFSITKINAGTFQNCVRLQEIVLPRTVKTIGSSAFKNCRELWNVFLPSVTTIGESAFENCISLTTVNYSKKLTSVDAFAFRNTAWLNSQTDEFVFIGKGILLQWNGSGSEVTLPWGTVRISGTFAENDMLESVTLPDTVRVIGKYAFRNAVNLKRINIPIYMTTIDVSAFEGCRSLENVEFPSLLTTIGASAFRGCSQITEITIPAKVKTINALTFADCDRLQTVALPQTVTKINKNSFQGSDKVVLQVTKDSAGEDFAKTNSISYQLPIQQYDDLAYYLDDDGIHISKYIGNQTIVEIPYKIDGILVTVIDSGAFQHYSCVRAILLPASLKQIGEWAFSYMKNLEYVLIPAGLKSLGANAFTGSSSLKQIQLPRRLQNIGNAPFDRSSEIKICVWEGSESSVLLAEQGYTTNAYDSCSAFDKAAIQNDLLSVCQNNSASDNIESREVVIIPDGLSVLTPDLIQNAGKYLFLIIPSSIEEIDPEIMEGRDIIIVSQIGTAAEAFASENNIEFYLAGHAYF